MVAVPAAVNRKHREADQIGDLVAGGSAVAQEKHC